MLSSLARGGQGVGRSVLRWAFWSPWRLAVALLCAFIFVVAAGQLDQRLGDAGQSSQAPSSPLRELPTGWETWPPVVARSTGVDPEMQHGASTSAHAAGRGPARGVS